MLYNNSVERLGESNIVKCFTDMETKVLANISFKRRGHGLGMVDIMNMYRLNQLKCFKA